MFIRQKRNATGTVSVQVIQKRDGKYRVLHTVGCGDDPAAVLCLQRQALEWIETKKGQLSFDLLSGKDKTVVDFLEDGLEWIRPAGATLVLNALFDEIGFNIVAEPMFRHLVLCRIIYPGSKLRTTEYLARHHGIYLDVESVYRFMDRFEKQHRKQIEQVSYEHTCTILGGAPTAVFYDVTTLYFEASQEDELRKTGFSKDGKAQNPQIVLGLLVAEKGYPLAFEMFEGNKYEGHTMLPVIEAFKKRFKIEKLTVVADAGLLSSKNIQQLIALEYEFILGARLKSENQAMKEQVLKLGLTDGQTSQIVRPDGYRLIVNQSAQRAKKDTQNRRRGLEKLSKSIASGKLGKDQINNRGYNKFLKLKGELAVELDQHKITQDQQWDGLKGYLTNTTLTVEEVMENYKNLWTIEKAFRMSKTDLRFRPIFHRKKSRIQTHLCLAFCSYKLYKELERKLQNAKSDISPERAIQILNAIYEVSAQLPDSKKSIRKLQVKSSEQALLLQLFQIKLNTHKI